MSDERDVVHVYKNKQAWEWHDLYQAALKGWHEEAADLKQQLAEVTQERDDYQEVHEDKQRLVRKLDVIWNGEAGAATQASLCDLVAQIARELPDVRQQLATARREVWEEAAQLCEQLYDASNDREAVFYEELLTAAHAIRTQAAKEEA